jgi:UrcA family protein
MSKLVNRIAAIATLALAATPIIGLTAAHAGERTVPIARIQVGDLTLSNPTDAREFARRAHMAGARACDAQGLTGPSAKACQMDFRQDVQHTLTKQQAAQLRIAKRAGA